MDVERVVRQMWSVIIVLSILAMGATVAGVAAAFAGDRARQETLENRELDFQRGAVECQIALIDNETEEMGLNPQPYCLLPEVVRHYAPEVCVMFDFPAHCAEARG